ACNMFTDVACATISIPVIRNPQMPRYNKFELHGIAEQYIYAKSFARKPFFRACQWGVSFSEDHTMDRVQAKTIQTPKKNLRCILAAVKPDLCHTYHTRFAKRNTRCHSHQSSTNHSSIEQPSNQEGCIVFRYLG
ncbi:hypothetical protein GT037_005845, partial [Alternaria burnsii]